MVHPKAKFNQNYQVGTLPLEKIIGDPNNDSVRSIEELMTSTNELEYLNTFVVGICISMKHHSSSSSSTVTYSKGYAVNAKRQKAQSSWERLYVFADVSSPGMCFVILFYSSVQGNSFWEQNTGNIVVGSYYYIAEAQPIAGKGKFGPLPIIESAHSIIPVRMPNTYEFSMASVIPVVPIKENVPPGEQRYFCLHNVTNLQIAAFEIVNEGTCSGFACDRARNLPVTKHCGCFHKNENNGKYVGEFTVVLPTPNITGLPASSVVRKHRSLRTTNLFFRDFRAFSARYAKEEHYLAVRNRVQQCVTSINSKTGWTIVGWFRKGIVTDQSSDNAADGIANETVQLHISLIFPSKPNELSLTAYQDLQIHHDTLNVDNNNENN